MVQKTAVKHFTNGIGAVTKVPLRVTRIRSILLSFFVVPSIPGIFLLTDMPLVVRIFPEEILDTYMPTILHASIIVAIVLGSTFWYLRRRIIRSLSIKKILHDISHELRDSVEEILEGSFDGDELEPFVSHTKSLLPTIEQYYKLLLSRKDIKIAVRIKISKDERQNGDLDDKFFTIARSRNFHLRRAETSEGISSKKGEIELLHRNHCCGVLIYSDVNLALEEQLLYRTKNFDLFSDEIKSMMVAPINIRIRSVQGYRSSMIGVLYVSASEGSVFSEKDTDACLFIADLLAQMYQFILHSLNSKSVHVKE